MKSYVFNVGSATNSWSMQIYINETNFSNACKQFNIKHEEDMKRSGLTAENIISIEERDMI